MKRFKLSLYGMLLLLLTCCNQLFAEELVIATWGGPYEAAQRKALFDPFTQASGINIKTVPYNGGLDILDGESLPDLVDMLEAEARQACQQEKIYKLDVKAILSNGKRFPKRDFLPGAWMPCGVAHLTFSILIAFAENAFPGEKPRTIEDFFDTERFPGKRALRKEPDAILEWALMAEGVPIRQVYDLLSTDRGMRLALKRLESLRYHLLWWNTPEEPGELLASGKAVMASGYNGRFFADQMAGNALDMIWDGQIVDRDVWVVPRKTDKQDEKPSASALAFIRFATQAQALANLANYIPYGPTRLSAMGRIGLHPEHAIPMRDHLPTTKRHLEHALFRDTRWYAKTAKWRQQRFEAWLATGKTSDQP